jgi:rod shape-determining protein MreD
MSNLHPLARTALNVLTIFGSASLCLLLLPTRFPGMEVLGVGPSWLVMWTIAWSLHRSIWHAATAGIILGLIQDGMTFPASVALGSVPTHVLSLTTVAVMTVWLHKRRYLNEAILPVTIATFFLTICAELVTGGQYLVQTAIERSLEFSFDSFSYLWEHQSSVMFITAILSSLWMPIIYYPLHHWWQKMLANTKLI